MPQVLMGNRVNKAILFLHHTAAGHANIPFKLNNFGLYSPDDGVCMEEMSD